MVGFPEKREWLYKLGRGREIDYSLEEKGPATTIKEEKQVPSSEALDLVADQPSMCLGGLYFSAR